MENTANKGNFLTGIIGALIGAVIGAIPWFICSRFLGMYLGILGAVISIASFFGYTKLNGRKNFGFALVVVIIFSIIAVLLSEFISMISYLFAEPDFAAVAAENGMGELEYAILFILYSGVLGELARDLLICILFVGLGIFSSYKMFRPYFVVITGEPAVQPADTADAAVNFTNENTETAESGEYTIPTDENK